MLPEAWTILNLLKWTTSYFKSHDIEQPRAASEILLAHTLSMDRVDLYIQYDRPLDPKELAVFRGLIQRRLQREPVAYIVGEKGFWSLDLKVTPDVLIPRPETEVLVETALSIIPPEPSPEPFRILDLGTGSGAVVLALASERSGHCFYGVDYSHKALTVARDNCLRHGLGEAITLLQGNWFESVKDRRGYFNIIVSNPPYVSDSDFQILSPEVSRYEPREALEGGPDGLNAIRIIIEKGIHYMTPGGWLLFEICHNQRTEVERLITVSGAYTDFSVVKDSGGFDRVIRVRANTAEVP